MSLPLRGTGRGSELDRIIVHFISGARAGHTEVYPVARFESLYIGRDPGCDVRVDPEREPMVSRSHAVVEWLDDEEGQRSYLLTDLLSSNGSYLNGERVRGTVEIRDGDHVRLGAQGPEFVFGIERAQPDQQPAITQSVRVDPHLRTPPPLPRAPVGAASATGATRRGSITGSPTAIPDAEQGGDLGSALERR
ncbi:MAG: hypothetical protein OMOMHJEC_00401 [Xanthomonadales bacterium]|nr:hypothetical protein [Xanthomonadales bacterium]